MADRKIALIIRLDLAPWQKMNVTAFLASGVVAEHPEIIGAPYEDGDGTLYARLSGTPILIYGGEGPALNRALERALARAIRPALYTEEMFKTGNDDDNRAVVKAVKRADMKLAGLAVLGERKIVDKILDGLKFHP